MKLVIQIPCFNEAATLPQTLRDLPETIEGIDTIERVIVDDGSGDDTIAVARTCGVDHIVSLTPNRGLAAAFTAGLDKALKLGADVIVNTDGDNQYSGADIVKLCEPILQRRADMVIGCRSFEDIEHFSWLKKRLQRIGSWVVRLVSGTTVRDASSGFRAFSREAALRMNVYSPYTYTMDTVIQAGSIGLKVESVDIRTNPKTRDSRLFDSTVSYLGKVSMAILRIFLIYRPARFFFFVGLVPFLSGSALCVRWLILYLGELAAGEVTRGREPSLILAAILIIIAVQIWFLGLVADLSAANRKLNEDILYRLKRRDLDD